MYTRSTLTQTEAASVIELFEEGFTAKSVALALDLTPNPVHVVPAMATPRSRGAGDERA